MIKKLQAILWMLLLVFTISMANAASIITTKNSLPSYGNCPLNKATGTQRYKVYGTGLTANLMITATANFEVSLNVNKGFCQSIQLVPNLGKVDSTEIYVRFVPTSTGALIGQINHSTVGATNKSITLSGTGVASLNIPTNYYSSQTGTGSTLLSSLSSKISGHTVSSYAGLWAAYLNTDPYYDGKLWDIYSTAVTGNAASYTYTFSTNQCGSYANEGDCYNREHSFPQSWFADASPMVSDMHHIFPTDGKVNGMRNNYPYGEVNAPTYTSQIGGKLGPSVTAGYTGIVFEPVDEYKGDVARAQFYMATRYNSAIASWVTNGNANDILAGNAYPVFDTWFLNLLIKWHNQDPPSVKEINRNNAIYGYQGNRNPYIDSPQFVNKIWGLALPSQPTIAAESLQVDSFANNKAKISWKTGNGANRIVLMRAGQAIYNFPLDSINYIANASFGLGSKIGNDIYVVYNGAGSSVWVNGLQNNTNYYVAVIEYNGINQTSNYLQSTPSLAGPYSQSGCTGNILSLATDSIQSCTSYVKLDAGSGFTSIQWSSPSTDPASMLNYNPADNSVNATVVYANATGWFKAIVTNAAGCSGSDSIYVKLNTDKRNIISLDSVTSCLDSVLLSSNSGFSNYVWSSGQTTSSIYVKTSAWFKVQAVNAYGCIVSDSIYVKLNTDKRNVLLSDSLSSCTDSLLLSATIGFTNFSWSSGQTTSSIYVKTGGWFKVQAVNAYGCSVSDSIYVKLNTDKRNIISLDSLSSCTDSLLLSATNGFTNFSWSSGQTTSSIYVKTGGWFKVQAVNAYGCIVSDSIYVKLNTDKRNVLLSDSLSSCTDSLLLSATNGFTNFSWSSGQTTSSIYVKTSGWFKVQAVNTYGCIVKDSVYISMNQLPSVLISTTAASENCSGKPIELSTSAKNNVTYQWYKNNIAINGAAGSSFLATQSGAYKLQLTSSVNCGFIESNTITLSIQTPQLPAQPENLQYVFHGKNSASFHLASNWYQFQAASNSFEQASTVPSSANKISILPVGPCVFNQPLLTAASSINVIGIEDGATLDLNGNKLNIAGTISGKGRIKGSNGSINFTGTTNAGTLYMDSLNHSLSDLSYTQSFSLGNQLVVTGNISPLGGTMFTQGNLVLASSNNQTAQIKSGTGTYINGEVTVQRYIPGSSGRRYRYLAAPFVNGPNVASSWQQQIHITGLGTGGSVCPNLTANSNGFDATNTSTFSMLTYDEQSAISFGMGAYGTTVYANAWKGITSTYSHQLSAGTGYNVFVRGNRNQGCTLLNGSSQYQAQDVTLNAKGTIQTGNFQFPITYTPANGKGWNLIGNPYPSAIEWSDNAQAWQRSNVENAFWIYKPSGDHYASWNGMLQLGTNQASSIIESGSAFFVKTNASNPALTITEQAKKNQPQASTFFKNEVQALRLVFVKPGKVQDESIIAMQANASNSKDEYDTEKMGNTNLNVYTQSIDGESLAIQTIPSVTNYFKIPLLIQSNFTGEHVFSFKDVEQFNDFDVLLEDNYNGVVLHLQEQKSYAFQLNSNLAAEQQAASRFNILFVNKGSELSLKHDLFSTFLSSNLVVYPNPSKDLTTIQAKGFKGEFASIKLLNIQGQLVLSNTEIGIQNGMVQFQIQTNELSKGIYLIEIEDANGTKKQGKFIIE